jgi:hypothetical protein
MMAQDYRDRETWASFCSLKAALLRTGSNVEVLTWV